MLLNKRLCLFARTIVFTAFYAKVVEKRSSTIGRDCGIRVICLLQLTDVLLKDTVQQYPPSTNCGRWGVQFFCN